MLGPDHIEVAVKVLKNESEKVKLLKEAAIMGQFAHPNIVQLYGLTTITEPVSVHGVMQGWFEIGQEFNCCSSWCSGTLEIYTYCDTLYSYTVAIASLCTFSAY